jgi:transposase-like protein
MPSVEGPTWVAVALRWQCVCVCLRSGDFDKIPTFSHDFTQSGLTYLSCERLIDCLCCVVHSNTHCCVCLSYYPGHVRGCRSVSATDGILTGSRMVRLTAQQRSELVQLHLQGESIDAIVRQTGHARTTVLRWVRGFTVDCSLSDRTRSGRPVTVMTPTVVGRINTIGKGQTRLSESINASGRCHAELSRDSHHPHLRASGAPLQGGQALCPTSGAAAAVWRQAAAIALRG